MFPPLLSPFLFSVCSRVVSFFVVKSLLYIRDGFNRVCSFFRFLFGSRVNICLFIYFCFVSFLLIFSFLILKKSHSSTTPISSHINFIRKDLTFTKDFTAFVNSMTISDLSHLKIILKNWRNLGYAYSFRNSTSFVKEIVQQEQVVSNLTLFQNNCFSIASFVSIVKFLIFIFILFIFYKLPCKVCVAPLPVLNPIVLPPIIPVLHRGQFKCPKNVSDEFKEAIKNYGVQYGPINYVHLENTDFYVAQSFIHKYFRNASFSFDGSDLVIFPIVYVPSWMYKNVQTTDCINFSIINHVDFNFTFKDIFGSDSTYVRVTSFHDFALYRKRTIGDPFVYLDIFTPVFLSKITSELISNKGLHKDGSKLMVNLIRSNMSYFSYNISWLSLFIQHSSYILEFAQSIVNSQGMVTDEQLVEFASSVGRKKRSRYKPAYILFLITSASVLVLSGVHGWLSYPSSLLLSFAYYKTSIPLFVGFLGAAFFLNKVQAVDLPELRIEDLAFTDNYMVNRCETRNTDLRGSCKILEVQIPTKIFEPRAIKIVVPHIKTLYVYHSSTTWNALTANVERQMKVFPRTTTRSVKEDFFRHIQNNLVLPSVEKVMSHSRYIHTRKWSYQKKESYRLFLSTRRMMTMAEVPNLHRNFVKGREFILDDPNKAPRNINAANEACIFVMGRVFASIYKSLSSTFTGNKLSVHNYREFYWSSGKTLSEIGQWCSSSELIMRTHDNPDLYYIGLDYSKYDASQTNWMFKLLGDLYLLMVKEINYHEDLKEYTRRKSLPWRSLHVNYRDKGKLMFKIDESRPTGDPDTTVGNTLLNLCFLDYVLKPLGIRFACALHGDDSFLIINLIHKDLVLNRLEILKQLGMEYTLEHSNERVLVEYNSKIFINVDVKNDKGIFCNQIILANKIGRSLSKTPLEWRAIDNLKAVLNSKINKSRSLSVDLCPYSSISFYFSRMDFYYSRYHKNLIKHTEDPNKQSYGLSHNSIRTSHLTMIDLSVRYQLPVVSIYDWFATFRHRQFSMHVLDDDVSLKIHDIDVKIFNESEIEVFERIKRNFGDLSF